jgi:spore coat polysaccharide biosynthesis protein SpsF (cytidylyltransferase family)
VQRAYPIKMMLHIHGYPVIHWIYQRLQQSKLLDNVIFAIPDTVADIYIRRLSTTITAS